MSLERIIAGLIRARAAFVIVGMVAGQMYGSRIATFDLDIAYDADEANMERIATFLLGIDAYVKDSGRTRARLPSLASPSSFARKA